MHRGRSWHAARRPPEGVAVAAVCYSLIPVVSLALTAIVIGDTPTPLQLLGGAVIVGSAIAAQIGQLRRR